MSDSATKGPPVSVADVWHQEREKTAATIRACAEQLRQLGKALEEAYPDEEDD